MVKRKILAVLIALCCVFGLCGISLLSSGNTTLADAAETRNTAIKFSDKGYTAVGAVNTTVSGNHTGWEQVGCEFDIVGATFSSTSTYIPLYFDLSTGFGLRSGNLLEIDFMNGALPVRIAAGNDTGVGNTAMQSANWAIYNSLQNLNSPDRSVTAGADTSTWIDFTTKSLEGSNNCLHVKAIWYPGRNDFCITYSGAGVATDLTGAANSQTLTVTSNTGVITTSTTGTYYPTVWFGRLAAGDSITIDNFKVFETTTTKFSTDFSDEGDVCYNWPFNAPFCANGGGTSFVRTGTLPAITANGQNLRLSGTTGLRFVTSINATNYKNLVSTYGEANIELGHVLAPQNLTERGGNELFNNGNIPTLKNISGGQYDYGVVQAVRKNWHSTDNSSFNAVLTGIPSGKETTAIIATPYLKVVADGTTFVYYGNIHNQNYYKLAETAYEDRSATKTGEYIYVTEEGDYSKYPTDQLTVLQKVVGDKKAKYQSYYMKQHDYLTMPIACYIAPTAANTALGTQNLITDGQYSLVKQSGINTVIAYSDYLEQGSANDRYSDVVNALAYCNKYGLSYIATSGDICNSGGVSLDSLKYLIRWDTLKNDPNFSALGGLVMKDEPASSMFAGYKKVQDYFLSLAPDLLAWGNLLPQYAANTQLFNAATDASGSQCTNAEYCQYVSDYRTVVQPQVYSFDNYCCWSGTTIHSTYFANLYNVRANALVAQKPFWSFVNTMSFGAMRLPTQADIYFCVNTALSYGAKGIEYFTYVRPTVGGFTGGGMVDAAGNKQSQYTYVQNANKQIAAVDDVLMCCLYKGLMKAGSTPATIPDTCLTSYGPCTGFTASHGIMGCFDYNGGYAYYVTNNSVTANDTFTATLTGKSGYVIYGTGTKANWSNTCSATLTPGQGALIVVN